MDQRKTLASFSRELLGAFAASRVTDAAEADNFAARVLSSMKRGGSATQPANFPPKPFRDFDECVASHTTFRRPMCLNGMTLEITMPEKFDPAPLDKHAADPKEAAKADKATHDELEKGLKGSFPASDPVSATQPAPTKHDSNEK